jgi:hypothetical protein
MSQASQNPKTREPTKATLQAAISPTRIRIDPASSGRRVSTRVIECPITNDNNDQMMMPAASPKMAAMKNNRKSSSSFYERKLYKTSRPEDQRARAIQFSNEDEIINRRGRRGTQRIDYSSAYLCALCG